VLELDRVRWCDVPDAGRHRVHREELHELSRRCHGGDGRGQVRDSVREHVQGWIERRERRWEVAAFGARRLPDLAAGQQHRNPTFGIDHPTRAEEDVFVVVLAIAIRR
jgi:hypothetical protein